MQLIKAEQIWNKQNCSDADPEQMISYGMDIVQSMDDDAIKYKPNFDQIKGIEDKGKDLNHGNHCFNFESNFEACTMYIGNMEKF